MILPLVHYLPRPSDNLTYKRVEWWDQREGALPNPDVQYPELEQAAAFVCTDRSCSPPIFSPDKISSLVGRPPEG